jgi:ribosomal protein S18 acetylase RimI-like enzyme
MTTPGPTATLLAAQHLRAYRELMLEAYARHPDAFTSTAQERAAMPDAWWSERLGSGERTRSLALGVFLDGEMAGAVALTFETKPKTRHNASLVGMYVRERFRGRGVGRSLVDAALAAARARPGLRLVQLTVSEHNAQARTLYERCGFVAFGLEPMAMLGPEGPVAKCHMWCDLDGASRRSAGA